MILPQKGFSQLVLLLIVVITFGVIGTAAFFLFYPAQFGLQKTDSNAQAASGNDCGTTKQLLSVSPVKVADLSTIIPLGNIAPPGHILPTFHMYYNYQHSGSLGNRVPVLTTLYVPADMTVRTITLFDNNSSAKPFNSYRIDFTICNQVTGYFIHVITLNDALKAAFHEPYDRTQTSDVGASKPDHTYAKDVNVTLKAGEILGTGGGTAGLPDGLDFALADTRVPVKSVVNPSMWSPDALHYVCTLDYFPTDLSKELYTHIGNYDYKFVNPGVPQCGEIYQDKIGTAQGVWFAKGSTVNDFWNISKQLSLIHSNLDHSQGVFAIGGQLTQLGLDNSASYSFTPSSTGDVNKDFSQVSADGRVYCYNTNQSTTNDHTTAILIQLLDSNTLRIGKLDIKCGSGPWQFNKYLDYTR